MSTRTFTVAPDEAGRTVAEWLRARLGVSRSDALRMLGERRVRVGGADCLEPATPLRRNQRVEVRERQPEAPREPPPARPVVRFADEHVVVVDKPAGLTTVRHAEEAAEFGARGRRFLPPTLADLLPDLLPGPRRRVRPRVRAVHRLDRDTSGLVVFARTAAAESHLGKQFRAHSVERSYLAVVRGRAAEGRVESHLVEDRGDGRRGSGPKERGKRAVTCVKVVEALGAYTLLECRLETGRTHQVRIHLGEAGTPLCGERVYDRPPHGKPLPDGSGAARVALHAATLGFDHPETGDRVRWTSPLPRDLAELLRRLRAGSPS